MNGFQPHLDPPRSLAERLELLNDNLHSLSGRLKDAVANAFSTAVGEAVHDVVRHLLGTNEPPAREQSCYHQATPDSGLWQNPEEPGWQEEDEFQTRPPQPSPERKQTPGRWGNALGMAVQAALWWMRQQPRRRPLLTTAAVAVAAGITAFLAGPALAAGVGVLASTAGLFLTAKAASSVSEHLRSLAPG
jgi:hypothetical protein